jgi:hypothetical protein
VNNVDNSELIKDVASSKGKTSLMIWVGGIVGTILGSLLLVILAMLISLNTSVAVLKNDINHINDSVQGNVKYTREEFKKINWRIRRIENMLKINGDPNVSIQP